MLFTSATCNLTYLSTMETISHTKEHAIPLLFRLESKRISSNWHGFFMKYVAVFIIEVHMYI